VTLNATDVRKGKLRRTTQLGKFAFAGAEPRCGLHRAAVSVTEVVLDDNMPTVHLWNPAGIAWARRRNLHFFTLPKFVKQKPA
jgi:hypothetical protein